MTATYLPPSDRARAIDKLGGLEGVDLGKPCPVCSPDAAHSCGHLPGCRAALPRPTPEVLAAAWEPARNGWTP